MAKLAIVPRALPSTAAMHASGKNTLWPRLIASQSKQQGHQNALTTAVGLDVQVFDLFGVRLDEFAPWGHGTAH